MWLTEVDGEYLTPNKVAPGDETTKEKQRFEKILNLQNFEIYLWVEHDKKSQVEHKRIEHKRVERDSLVHYNWCSLVVDSLPDSLADSFVDKREQLKFFYNFQFQF